MFERGDSGTKRKEVFKLEMAIFITERGIFYKSSRRRRRRRTRPCHTRNIVAIESQKVVSSIDITAKRPLDDHSENGLEKH